VAVSKKYHDEIIKCGREPVYFLNTYCKISTPKEGIIPLSLFKYQEKVIKDYQKHRFNIILKARQTGISTITAAYAVWLMLFHNDKNILIVAIKKDTAMNLIYKCKEVFENLPDWLLTKGKTPTGITRIKSETKTSIGLENGSRIKAVPTSPDAGRSEALSLAIIDEAAHIKDINEVYTSLYSTISTGGSLIMISSPLGVGNLFHKIYTEAEAGKNNYNPIKIIWSDRPDYNKKWFELITANMNKREIAQEYLADFLSSGETFIDAEDMEYVQSIIKTPIERTWNDRGLWIWEYPNPNHQYILSADISRGDKKDFSAIHIIDNDNLEVVAEYQGKITVDKLAEMIDKYGRLYNNALICPENNTIGYAVIRELMKLNYPNCFHKKNKYVFSTNYNPINDTKQDWGVYTGAETRPRMLQKLSSAIEKKLLKVYSSRFYNELQTFIWDGQRFVAQNHYTDDIVMSLAIGIYIIDLSDRFGGKTDNAAEYMLKAMSVSSVEFQNPADKPAQNWMPISMGGGEIRNVNSQRFGDRRIHPMMNDWRWILK